jgi:hypothetical protein
MTGGRAQSPRALSANPSVNMRGRNGSRPSVDNPSRKITFTSFVAGDTLGIRVLRVDHKGACAGDDAGFATVTAGSPSRCSTRRQASPNSGPSAQEPRPRRKRRNFSPQDAAHERPDGSQIDQALTYCDLGLSGSVGRSAKLFPEAALNQTGGTPD